MTVLRELTPSEIASGTIGAVSDVVAEQVAVSDEETLSELEDGGIVWTKVAPMTLEEASSHMELLGTVSVFSQIPPIAPSALSTAAITEITVLSARGDFLFGGPFLDLTDPESGATLRAGDTAVCHVQ